MRQNRRVNQQLDPALLLCQRRRCTSTMKDHRPLQILSIMVDEGLEESTVYTDLVRKTYTCKHGSFIDERAEALVEEVEQAVEDLTHGRSPLANSQTGSTAATPHSGRLRGQTHKGNIHGHGSVQFKNYSTSESVSVTLKL